MKAKAGASAYLFPSTVSDRHQTEIKKLWSSVCRQAGITGCRIHDLRHTHASILASAGLSLPVIGALLGHTQPQTTHRYSHLLDDPLRQAAEKVGAVWTGNGESAEVVPLRRGA
jgi:integrase